MPLLVSIRGVSHIDIFCVCHRRIVLAHSGEGYQVPSDGRKTNVALLAQVYRDENEMAFYSFDLYGHGYSEGTRFFIPSWQENLSDYLSFVRLVTDQYKDNGDMSQKLPVFLFGTSYGGTLTLHAARRIQQSEPGEILGGGKSATVFAGILLASPAVEGDLPPAPVYWFLRYVLAPLCPKWTPFFMPNPIGPDRIWKDEDARALRTSEREREMRLSGSGCAFRLGTALSLVQSMDAVLKDTIPTLRVPLYLMHGTSDYGVPISGSEWLRQHVASPAQGCVYDFIEGGYHDLLSGPESKSYLEKTLSWMEQRMVQARATPTD